MQKKGRYGDIRILIMFFLCVLINIFLNNIVVVFAETEEITLSTYYPAPYGEYDYLYADRGHCDRLAIGDTNGNGTVLGDYGDLPNNPGDLLVEGKVGIGTTVPLSQLDVRDNTGTIALNTAAGTILSASVTEGTMFGNLLGGNDKVSVLVASPDTAAKGIGGAIGFGGKEATASDTVVTWCAILGAKENAQDNDNSGYLAFGTKAPGSFIKGRMRITSTGNVGIGTTAPGEELEIYSVSPVLRLRDSDATASATAGFIEFGGTDAGSWNRTGYIGDVAPADTNIYLVAEDGRLYLGDESGSQVVTLSSGNVGIGTTEPDNRLHVMVSDALTPAPYSQTVLKLEHAEGAYLTLAGPESSNNGILWQSPSAYYQGRIYFHTGTGKMSFSTNAAGSNGFDRVTIDSSGDVGIGTATPASLLFISKSKNGLATEFSIENSYCASGSIDETTKITSYFGGYEASSILTGKEEDFVNGGEMSSYLSFWTRRDGNMTEAMRINKNGDVGIGVAAPSKKLYVSGSAGGTQNWNASDLREKKDIETIYEALDRLMQIRGVKYKWKDGDADESKGFDNKTHFGVIAQEVELFFPELVDYPGDTKEYKHLEYNGLIGILIEAVKEQQREIKVLEQRIKQLE